MFDLTFEPIAVKGQILQVEVVRKRVRGSNARVRDGKVVITLPERMNRISASITAKDLYRRISAGLAKKPERYLGMPDIIFRDGQLVTLFEKRFLINMTIDPSMVKASTRIRDGNVMVTIPEAAEGKASALSRLAKRSLTRHLLGEVEAEVRRINSEHFNAEIDVISLRDMLWTWGSYRGHNRSITLNFRLLYAPRPVLEYVIVHELAHSRVGGHSRAFWAHVARVLPDYKQRRKWLREHSHDLGLEPAESGRQASGNIQVQDVNLPPPVRGDDGILTGGEGGKGGTVPVPADTYV